MSLTADQTTRIESIRARIEQYEALSLSLAGIPHTEVRKHLVSYGFQSPREIESVISDLYDQLDMLNGGARIKMGAVTFRG